MVDREPRHQSPAWIRLATLAAGLFFAIFIGTAAGLLGWTGGSSVPTAIITGLSAFTGSLALAVALFSFLKKQD
jgi:hypothetical protein